MKQTAAAWCTCMGTWCLADPGQSWSPLLGSVLLGCAVFCALLVIS